MVLSGFMIVTPVLTAAETPLCPPQTVATTGVLVPMLADNLPGANGSVWSTDLWVGNTTDCPVVFFFSPCVVACCCVETNTYAPQTMTLVNHLGQGGRWFNLPADKSLQFQVRFRDLSRAESSAGIDLPLIDEADFHERQLDLLGIPSDTRFRVTLRLYGITAGTTLRVEMLDSEGVVLQSQLVALAPPTELFDGSLPAFAQVTVPQRTAGSGSVRLRITAESQGARFWAFASVTNNETSEVTLIVPSW